ncbi:MAG: ATP-binding protein [Pseudomonadales bacterium]|jgi:signal transduction histidine kinase/ActR/RegA family two-component response regulator|nr:ATP-binding protein [Pseudomonadales bacterium]
MGSEVARRQLTTIIDALREEGADALRFFREAGAGALPVDGNPAERIDWDDYAAVMAAALERWGDVRLAELGARSLHVDDARSFRDAIVLAFDSAQAAVAGFLGGAVGANSIIHSLTIELLHSEPGRLALRSRMLPGYAPSLAHEVYSTGVFRELPRLFYEPAARVELEPTADGANFEIRFGHRGLGARLLSRLERSRPKPEFLNEVRTTVDALNRRQAQLQAEAEKTRQMEAMLHQAQKMQAVGTLTGGIAHDFNNLLGVVMGQLDLLAETSLDEEQREMLDDAREATRRSARLTRQLLSFSRRADHEVEVVDPNAVVRSVEELAARTLPASVAIQLDLAADAWPVEADASRLENALLNLALNACDAMDASGELAIRTASVELQAEQIAGEAGFLPAGDYLRISVADTGCGMSPELVEHAFEPFFTTKARGAGTGLGLAMVWRFANESGGSVEIVSEPDRGTTVQIYLPRSQRARQGAVPKLYRRLPETDRPAPARPAPEAAPRPSRAASAAAGTETRATAGTGTGAAGTQPFSARRLLLLEDQDDVRRVVARMLEREGYEVVPTATGPEALEALRADETLGLILCDVMLPGGSLGPDVVARAREFRPGLRVVFMSGYAGDVAAEPGRMDAGDQLLPKPLSREALVAALDRIRPDDAA